MNHLVTKTSDYQGSKPTWRKSDAVIQLNDIHLLIGAVPL
jgi:hypothetical protein